jgi:CheY-like chemotaxis protein
MSAMQSLALNEETYPTTCSVCAERFDAMVARWCECVAPLRSLRCPHCDSCFCRAPLPYKRRFWVSAPATLRQDPRRFYIQLHTSPAFVGNQLPPLGVRRPVVLIVDDDEAMKSLVACYTEQLGYRTMTSSDPIEALDVIGSQKVDVVITDALMPKMDGRELCQRIKARPDGAEKRVIVMSSLYKSRMHQTEAVTRFGADAMITKPIDFPVLSGLLERLAPI